MLAACGGTDEQDRLAEDLVEESGGALDREQAECVAGELEAAFGDDSYDSLVDAAAGRGDDVPEVRTRVIDIFSSCDALDAVLVPDGS